jgi:eukaryotic-like serine/threonine-protein kinase
VRREYNDEVPANRVIETSPPERSRLERGRTVTLVVSRGSRKVEVPSVVGEDRDEAERLVEGRGLQVSVTEREDADEEPGTVLAQTPAAGTEVAKDSTVTLTVAKAPPQVEVPDVLGEDVDDAAKLVEGAGFKVRRREQTVDSPEGDGVVITQNPPSGEKRDKGSSVTLIVGKFEPPDPEASATPTPSPTP